MTKNMTKVFVASLLLALLAGCMPVPNNAEYYGAKRALQGRGTDRGTASEGALWGAEPSRHSSNARHAWVSTKPSTSCGTTTAAP